ncbi:MAG: hypothetical protein FWE67_05980 [Planctomycetaceae bacterium]|nr:hypothetical protein [Planctomycetaceae bacterium]
MNRFILLAFLVFSAETLLVAENWDVQSDTWVATDKLGRTLPTFEQTGPPKKNKIVAMFYFLWNGRHGEQGPFDVTEILKKDPDAMKKKDSPLWGPIHAPHHWGESIFGYYVGEDEYVLRKHAQMLGDAGVDVVIFDVTNQLTYPESYRALCKVFSDVRAAGNHAPQIAFLCPFGTPKKVVHELWRDLYSKGDYADLWFRWDGKPFILANPEWILESIQSKRVAGRDAPVELKTTLGQKFTVQKPFLQIGAAIPTWCTKDSGFTITLRQSGPNGKVVKSADILNHPDNNWGMMKFAEPLPPGTYYLELSKPQGKAGWWCAAPHRDFADGLQGFIDGEETESNFDMILVLGDEESPKILDFFTFRKPQPDYFQGPTGPNQWSWLEVYPQHGFYALEQDSGGNERKIIEEVSVGIAQNAVDGKLGVLSNPRAHGRSFHNGKQPAPEDCDYSGRNFDEQWKRAYELDPKAVFITSWNEWIMGRFDEKAPFHGSDVVSFVDQFNHEFSRDAEPVKGGHEDAYYYQLIGHIRRFKGTRPLEKIVSKLITIDGKFDDWTDVKPEFRDTIGDIAHRSERGWEAGSRYENTTGRNDIIAAKVSRDENNIYFYVRTAGPLVGQNDGNWMILFLDTDCKTDTGWLGYDFVFNRIPVMLEKNVGGKYEWDAQREIEYKIGEKEIELAIPREALGNPQTIHFKWCDNIKQTGEWSDFTLHGDSAPNDRYNYRAE